MSPVLLLSRKSPNDTLPLFQSLRPPLRLLFLLLCIFLALSRASFSARFLRHGHIRSLTDDDDDDDNNNDDLTASILFPSELQKSPLGFLTAPYL